MGAEPLQALHDAVVRPVGRSSEPGCGYRRWHLVSIDGRGLDVADEQGNADAFGRPGASRGESAFPQIRFVSLVENGTHVLFGSRLAGCAVGEQRLARDVVPALSAGMLCLADRNFFSYPLWNQARATGADLLWRIKRNLRLPRETPLADGSYLSRIYPSQRDRRHQLRGVCVRVIEYQLSGVVDAEPLYRLLTTVLDAEDAPARELAALYHERWEIETAFDELKTHLRGARIVLRSKTPELVRQEFWGLMLAHYAIRALMYEAARQRGDNPDGLSYVHAVRVIRRDIDPSSVHPWAGVVARCSRPVRWLFGSRREPASGRRSRCRTGALGAAAGQQACRPRRDQGAPPASSDRPKPARTPPATH